MTVAAESEVAAQKAAKHSPRRNRASALSAWSACHQALGRMKSGTFGATVVPATPPRRVKKRPAAGPSMSAAARPRASSASRKRIATPSSALAIRTTSGGRANRSNISDDGKPHEQRLRAGYDAAGPPNIRPRSACSLRPPGVVVDDQFLIAVVLIPLFFHRGVLVSLVLVPVFGAVPGPVLFAVLVTVFIAILVAVFIAILVAVFIP